VLTRPTRAVAAALALPLLLLTACSHSTGSRTVRAPVTMAFCGGSPQPRPTVVDVICTTNDITARNLAWSSWGKPVAIASGRAVVDMCAFEDCHSGLYGSFPIVVIASKIVSCAPHKRAYSRLQYVFVGRSPFQGLPANMNFSHYMVGASRPGPPPNQTVSLAC